MAITYTWKITNYKNLSIKDKKVVVQVYWTKTGTNENGISASFMGITPLTKVDFNNFVEYEDLNHDIVLNWVIQENEKNNDAINNKILEEIQKKISI